MAARFSVMADCTSLSAVTQASGCTDTTPAAVCLASGLDIHHCAQVSHYSLWIIYAENVNVSMLYGFMLLLEIPVENVVRCEPWAV